MLDLAYGLALAGAVVQLLALQVVARQTQSTIERVRAVMVEFIDSLTTRIVEDRGVLIKVVSSDELNITATGHATLQVPRVSGKGYVGEPHLTEAQRLQIVEDRVAGLGERIQELDNSRQELAESQSEQARSFMGSLDTLRAETRSEMEQALATQPHDRLAEWAQGVGLVLLAASAVAALAG